MMKVANTTLSLSLLLAAANWLPAQNATPAQVAEEEAVRRQEAALQLKQKLVQAQTAQQGGDLATASLAYEEAYALVQKVGRVNVDKEAQQTIAGLGEVWLKLAEQAEKRNDLNLAQTRVNRVLAVDPKNAAALNYKKSVDLKIAARVGLEPSQEMQAMIPEFRTNQIQNATLVQDGKLLYEMGRYDEADKKLEQALIKDPSNAGAAYYARLVKEGKFALEARRREVTVKEKLGEVERAWSPPIKGRLLPEGNPFATTNLVHTGPGRMAIQSKLDRIVLAETPKMDNLPLGAVVSWLDEVARQNDPDKQGINFVVSTHIDKPGPQQTAQQQFDANGLPLPAAPPAPVILDLAQDVTIRLAPPLRNVRLSDVLDAISKVAESPVSQQFQGIKYSIEEYAVVFSQKVQEAEQLYTRQFRVDPNTFYQGLENVYSISVIPGSSSQSGGGQGGYGGGGGGYGGGGQGGGQGGYGGGSGGGGGGGEIPRVFVSQGGGGGGGYGGQGGGQQGGGYGGGGGGQGGYGGQGGQGGQSGQGGGGFGSGIGITGVTRATFAVEWQSTVAQFFYTVTGIQFATIANLGTQQGGYGGVGGGAAAAQQYGGVGGQGVGGTTLPTSQRSLFFNDRAGVLFVRATMQELDIIDRAIQALNISPPQVTLEAKFVEITQDDNKSLGFDWFLGNVSMAGGAIGAQGGSAPSVFTPGYSPPGNPLGIFPGGGGAGTTGSAATDGQVSSGLASLNNGIPPVATLTGILTDPQFRMVIYALEQRRGVDVMSAPRITTQSGRQAQIQSTVQRQILASVSASAQGGGGYGASSTAQQPAAGAGNVVQQAQALPVLQPQPVSIPTGPTLDVIPYVSADGYTIQMTLIPSILDFAGYGNPDIPDAARFEASVQAQAGNSRSPIPLPRFLVRQITTSATVWDGQTIVLGGLISDDVRRERSKIPILGDIPLLGRLFRSETSGTAKKNLVVFVTATIIDPAGNRVHTEDNLPYDPTLIPPQRPGPTK